MKRAVLLASMVACATPPLATPAATDLTDAWATAAGGRVRLARVATVHARGRMEKGGIEGPIERWETARGQREERYDLGGVERETTVFDGAHGWIVDRNHQVRELDGPELEEQVTLAALAAAPDRLPGDVTRAGDGLRIAVPRGRVLSVKLDPATHLPASIAWQDAEKTRVLSFSDWRDVDGARFPFTIRDEDGDPLDAITIHFDEILVNDVDSPAPPFTRPADGPRDWRFDAGDHVTLPIEIANGLIVVRATVNGSPPQVFLLDTGAEVSVINSSRLAKLGLQPIGNLAVGAGGGDVAMSYLRGVSFTLPGVVLHDQIVTAIPLDSLEPLFGQPIDGVLGYDFISRFVVTIDYDAKTLTLADPAQFQQPGGGEAIPITLAGSVPNTAATIIAGEHTPPLTAQFVIDTGCSCEVSFNAPFTTANRLLDAVHTIAPPPGSSRGAGGETHLASGHVHALSLGHQTVQRPFADFATDSTGAMADPELAGLLGGTLWRRFVVTFDYSRKTMWLVRGAHFAESSTAIGVGIVWNANAAHELIVAGLLPGAPGAEAGVQVGDVLITFDGTPAAKLSTDDVPAAFARSAGTPHALVLRRAGKEIHATVTARALF